MNVAIKLVSASAAAGLAAAFFSFQTAQPQDFLVTHTKFVDVSRDGCIGEDDFYSWVGSGTLQKAQTFTFSAGPNLCTGRRWITHRADRSKGKGGDVAIRLFVDTAIDEFDRTFYGVSELCVITPSSLGRSEYEPVTWTTEIINTSGHKLSKVIASGTFRNQQAWVPEDCLGWGDGT